MTTDFNYGKTAITSAGPFKPKNRNVPMNARYRVETYADIATIPVPAVGELIFVLSDENNDNQQNIYVIKSLKPSNLGVADSFVDEVVPLKTFLGTDDINLSDYVTEEELNNRGYATTTEVDQKIANAVTGGTVDLSEYQKITDDTLSTSNKTITGAINEVNSNLVASLNGKKISDLMTKEEYDALTEKDPDMIYLVDDDDSIIGLPDYSSSDANKVLAVNSNGTALAWIDAQTGGSNIQVEDTLTSTSTTNALSANQGRILNLSLNNITQRIEGLELGGNLELRDIETNEIFTVSNAEENIPVYGSIILSITSLSIAEGSAGSFTVSLSTAPTNNQTVNISVNNANCTVDKSSLTFTPDNYTTTQTVTVNAVHNSTNYSDLTSIVTLESDNVTTQKVNVTITNIDVEKEVSSISVVYTQGDTTVYPSTLLNSLKSGLVVTATYSDGSTSPVLDYSLSGELTEGSSTVTVNYQGKTATFTVTVSAKPESSYPISLETIDDTNYLSIEVEKNSDGTPADYLALSERTNYATDSYRYFTIDIRDLGVTLNKLSDFSKYIINGITSQTNFNTWRSENNIEESIMIYSKIIYCKVSKTNITSESSMDEIFKYIINNILQHNKLKINASDIVATLTSSDICSFIDDASTVKLTKDGKNVLISTKSAPFGSSLFSIGFLNNYGWYGSPQNANVINSGFAITSASSGYKFNAAIPIDHFTADNLELTVENCRNVITTYYSDIKLYSYVALVTA